MKRADEILAEAGQTFKDRNAVYGDNWKMVGAVMAAFFPNGVKLETQDDQNRYHIFMLKIVKLTRYVLNWEKGGHQDSIHDDMVYAAMLEMIDTEISERTVRASDFQINISGGAKLPESIIIDFDKISGVDHAKPGSDRTGMFVMGCKGCLAPEICYLGKCLNQRAESFNNFRNNKDKFEVGEEVVLARLPNNLQSIIGPISYYVGKIALIAELRIERSKKLFRIRFKDGAEFFINEESIEKVPRKISDNIPCNNCATIQMCANEKHCDLSHNGYR